MHTLHGCGCHITANVKIVNKSSLLIEVHRAVPHSGIHPYQKKLAECICHLMRMILDHHHHQFAR
ncbi:uncharacterized protein BJ212DRAFT_552385 [Suillus subaureus]|uniref:Uncharacterized protein n=1 Tax=Suillus subaureus TaxID=48587 RepID=A0A9P7ELB0_9AGAM|nr:uncharacterized protein BJ212DRAFT_552385 [Suillus subaureus]KAG1824898.1 hypothetical protein BJ212DRAFT_552385 [Suillus subaureus]